MKIKLLGVLLSSLFVFGCGERVRVGTGEVGKVVDEYGISTEIRQPSSFRLPVCFTSGCPYLIRLQVNKATELVKIDQVFIPKSKVDLSNVQVAVQFEVRQDESSMNTIFNEVRPGQSQKDKEDTAEIEYSPESRVITSDSVWRTYLQRKVPDIVIDVLRDSTIDDILTKIPEIRSETERRLQEQTKGLPVVITEASFPNGIGDIPEKVIDSYRSLYAVEADKQRQIKQLAADLEVEKKTLIVQQVRATNDTNVAKELGIPVDKYMQLKIAEKYADATLLAGSHEQPFALGSFPMLGPVKDSK